MRPLVVLDVAALSPSLLGRGATPTLDAFAAAGVRAEVAPSFPAVTSVFQASLTTGKPPSAHGVVANGFFDRTLRRVGFWEQSDGLVGEKRLWDEARRRDRKCTTALLGFQQSQGAGAEFVVTPAPVHAESGLVVSCWTKPATLDQDLAARLGAFPLANYWGPLAGHKSSDWLGDALVYLLERYRPTLSLAYLPHLDYNLQRLGPGAPAPAALPDSLRSDLGFVDSLVGRIAQAVEAVGAALVVVSDYTIRAVARAVHLNRVLRQAELLAVREVAGREHLDLAASKAFALCDHQAAHVYLLGASKGRVRGLLERTAGVARVLDREGQKALGADHARAGELVAVAEPDAWFAYPWWIEDAKAPEFARKVDIHRKPGYDPVELFFDPATKAIPLDAGLVKGSHGRPAERAGEGGLLLAPPEAEPLLAPAAARALAAGAPAPPEGMIPDVALKDVLLGLVFGVSGVSGT